MSDSRNTPARMSLAMRDGTLVVDGELDAHGAPELARELTRLMADGDVDIDMSGVSFMDSSGLRVLIEAHQQAADASTRLVIRRPSESVGRVIELGGLAGHLDITAD